MIEPKRLFDCIEYQLSSNPLPDMLAAKESGQWKKYSTQQVRDAGRSAQRRLTESGYGPQ